MKLPKGQYSGFSVTGGANEAKLPLDLEKSYSDKTAPQKSPMT